MDQELIPHLGMLLQAYRDAPAERRDEILLETLRKIKGAALKVDGDTRKVSVRIENPAKVAAPAAPPFEPAETFRPSRGEDRRIHPRMKCFVAVEVRVEGSSTPVWGNLSNSSLGGCFIETAAPLSSGKKLEIGLWVASGQIWIKGLVLNGIVTRTSPSVGARIKFEGLDGNERETLRQFIKYVESSTQNYQEKQGYLAQLKR